MPKKLLGLVVVLFLTAPIHAANFTWSQTNMTIPLNQLGSLGISLDTDGQLTTGVDVVITYNKSIIEIEPVVTASPEIYPTNFFLKIPTTDPDMAQLRLTSTGSDSTQTYFGSGEYAKLVIKPIATGTTTISFNCSPNTTTDTNISASETSQDLVDCSQLAPTTITITPAATTNPQNSQVSSSGDTDPTFSGYYYDDPTCDLPQPPVTLIAQTVDSTTILLTWEPDPSAVNHSLLYGTSVTSHEYGISNIGYTNQFLINYLQPNTTYHFALASINSCGISGFTGVTKSTQLITSTNNSTPQPEINLSTQELATITSVSQISQFPKPTPPPTLEPQPQTNPQTNSPYTDQSNSSDQPNIWTQIAIIFLPLFVIFILVNIIFFLYKYRRSLLKKSSQEKLKLTKEPVEIIPQAKTTPPQTSTLPPAPKTAPIDLSQTTNSIITPTMTTGQPLPPSQTPTPQTQASVQPPPIVQPISTSPTPENTPPNSSATPVDTQTETITTPPPVQPPNLLYPPPPPPDKPLQAPSFRLKQ